MNKRLGMMLLVSVLALPVGAQAADISGRGSIGAAGGAMSFLSGDDFGEGKARLIGHFVVKYNFSSKFAGVFEAGWGWNAYEDNTSEDDSLATVIPTTLGLEFRTRVGETKLWPHIGFGAGLYSLGVKDSFRTWANDPVTNHRLTWTSPGLYGKLGTEILFDNSVSMSFNALYHSIFSEDSERYPVAWGNQNTSFGEVRLGVNYYFTLKSSGPVPEADEADEPGDGN